MRRVRDPSHTVGGVDGSCREIEGRDRARGGRERILKPQQHGSPCGRAVQQRRRHPCVLVEAGADLEARDYRDDLTPLHVASVDFGREALFRLSRHGAAVDAQDSFLSTPLMCVARSSGTPGAAEAVDALLRAGADETIVGSRGATASDLIGMFVDEEDRLARVTSACVGC